MYTRTRLLPSPGQGAAPHDAEVLHASRPSATIVVGNPGWSHGIKLVELEQFRAPVIQPNVQGQVVGAAPALLYGAAHSF